MSVSRFVTIYSQALAWLGTVLLIAVLVADHRWLGQIPEIVVLFGAAVALRGLSVPLSKYSYLTQTALVGLAGSLLVGVPATALAVATATVVTDSLWQRKPLRVSWINLGREVITIVAAYGVYATDRAITAAGRPAPNTVAASTASRMPGKANMMSRPDETTES